MYACMHVCMYVCMYLYSYTPTTTITNNDNTNSTYHYIIFCCTVSFRNFKSQNFKLSVSNPKSKYVAYSSVLSRISNCQSLGRKNKHEVLKTDRNNINV